MMAASMDLGRSAGTRAWCSRRSRASPAHPASCDRNRVGSIHARSADARAYPKIVANYLADPIDQQMAVASLKIASKIMSQPAISQISGRPGHDPFPRHRRGHIRICQVAGGTLYHCVGTGADGQ